MTCFSVLTTTRADYGIYYCLLKEMEKNPSCDFELVVSGTHLEEEYGTTKNEILADGFSVSREIRIFGNDRSEYSIASAMAAMQTGFFSYLKDRNPDFAILLGDRFEMAAAALACTVARVPIVHLYGGELTYGAIDDSLRHAITKLSYIHLTATDEYRGRVIQMGEDPVRVFNIGALGIDQIFRGELLSRDELESDLGLSLDRPTLLVTFHPSTLETSSPQEQMKEILQALDSKEDVQVIFTLPNADMGRWGIETEIKQWCEKHSSRARCFQSLGHKCYLSLLQHVIAVVGNSSSGIIEAPSLKTATINIGDRQRGRVQAASTVNCACIRERVIDAIKQVMDPGWRRRLETVINPYGKGDSAKRAMQVMEKLERPQCLFKEFYAGLAGSTR